MTLDLDIDVLLTEQVDQAQQLSLRRVRGIRSVMCRENPGQRPFVPSGQADQARRKPSKLRIGSDRGFRLAFPGMTELGASNEPAEILITQPVLHQQREAALLCVLHLRPNQRARAGFLRSHVKAR